MPDDRKQREALRSQAAAQWIVEGIPDSHGNTQQAPQTGDLAQWRAAHNITGAIDELRRPLGAEKRQLSPSPRRRPHSRVRLLPAHLAEPERAERAPRIRVNTSTTHWGSETTYHAPGAWNID